LFHIAYKFFAGLFESLGDLVRSPHHASVAQKRRNRAPVDWRLDLHCWHGGDLEFLDLCSPIQ
jgi:hypothetical protein